MPRRLEVTDVNPHVVCTICDGYLVDATAIIECLHAFCRTCIVRYLENSKFCPVCDVQVHKTKPLESIRSDQTLQDLVYKMVPDLYQNEMQRRREFYAEHPKAASGRTPEERGEGEPRFFHPKESISLSLQHVKSRESKSVEQPSKKDPMTRHLNCPAAFTVGHLKKFIHLKFSLPPTCEVDVFYDDDDDDDDAKGHLLRDNFTLMDVAYIYSWKRAEPMKFCYSIAKRVPRYVEPSPPPPPEAVSAPSSETVLDDKVATDDVPEVPSLVTKATEAECMEVDSGSSAVEAVEIDNATAPAEVKVDAPELDSASSRDDVQKVDVPETKHPFNSSLPIKSNLTLAPLVPEPTYNSVKVVSAPEPNTLLSPTNGFRLKFIHDPELNPKKSSSKKSGRKGRSSRHKSAPVRLARLAPYPPPAAPVTCLTTPQHLSQLTVGKLVPSVITTLAPTFVTTLVSTTSNSVCSNVTNNATGVSNFLGQSSAVCTITTPNTLLTSPVLPSTADNAVTLSSTANTVTVSACSLGSAISTQQNSPIPTKELLSAEATPTSCSVPSTTLSVRTDVEKSTANNSTHSSVVDSSALTNSAVDSHPTNVNVPDSSLSPSPNPADVVSSSTRDVDGSEIVTSTSGDPVSTAVPIPHTDSDARGAFRESVEDAKSTTEHNCHSHGSTQNRELKSPVTSISSAITIEDSPAIVTSLSRVSSDDALPPKESVVDKRFHESVNTSSDLQSINNASTKESVSDKKSEPFSSFNGHDSKSRLSPKESTLVVDNENPHDSFKSIVGSEEFKKVVDVSKRATLEAMVKDTISAEFSDNDDLGCQSDLVVDEQKAGDSSENDEEDETDAALRKKINAIAEKEDETDDTEADSGRASDMSCPARCEEDMGSPMATDITPTTTSTVSTTPHHAKSNNIDHVIKQIYLQHEIGRSSASPKPATASVAQQPPPPPPPPPPQRDDLGVLDLSTCTRKPGETPSRPRAVANPVLDIKHRQQTYLPAPVRQHTACVPTPKHPTSSPLLMHQLTSHPPGSILQAQLTGKSVPPHHHPVSYSPYPLPNSSSNRAAVSSPSPLVGRSAPPSYSYRFAQQQQQAAAAAAASSVNMLAGMLPYAASGYLTMPNSGMAGFAPRAPRPSSTTSNSHRKEVSSPPCTSSSKMSSPTTSSSFNSHMARERRNWSSVSSSRKLSEALLSGGPNCRGSAALPTSPTGIPAHPRTSPSMLRMSPHHRSASPAPSPHSVSSNSTIINSSSPSATTTAAVTTSSSSSSQSKQSVPIYKKSDSFKGYNKFKRSANLAVFNPDPNGYRQKLVIKNLDCRSNSSNNQYH